MADRILYLQLPQAMAMSLIDDGLAAPYLRTDRLDPVLVPSLIVASATALVTVVTKSLTQATLDAIARRLKKAFGGRTQSADGPTATLTSAQPGVPARDVDLVAIPVEQLAALLRAAAAADPKPPGDAGK